MTKAGYSPVFHVSPDDLRVTGLDVGLVFSFGKNKVWLKDIFRNKSEIDLKNKNGKWIFELLWSFS
jgi:hypothetical protein